MIADAIKQVQALTESKEALKKPATEEIAGRLYSRENLAPIYSPVPEMLETFSLQSVVDYIEKNKDGVIKDEIFIHILHHTCVRVYSGANSKDNFCKRALFLQAGVLPDQMKFQFDQYQNLETMIINLQTYFEDTPDRQELLKVIGNVRSEKVKQHSDDGVSQLTIIKDGLKLAEAKIPNPLTLKPYRTFLEIEQPESVFVCRAGEYHEEVQIALFEADGGIWKLFAMRDIRNFLEHQLPGVTIIG